MIQSTSITTELSKFKIKPLPSQYKKKIHTHNYFVRFVKKKILNSPVTYNHTFDGLHCCPHSPTFQVGETLFKLTSVVNCIISIDYQIFGLVPFLHTSKKNYG